MGDVSIVLIVCLVGVFNGIISYYFQDKNGLLEVIMWYLFSVLSKVVCECCVVFYDDSLRVYL